MARCCLILGDQLSIDLPSLRFLEPEDVVVMAEVWSEASYVKHHKQKIALIFSAMRHFAADLRDAGREVIYIELTDSENSQSLVGEVERLQIAHQFDAWYVTEPGEWRLKNEFEGTRIENSCSVRDLSRQTIYLLTRGVQRIPQRPETTPDGAFLSEDQAIDRSTDGRQRSSRREVEF